MPESTRRRALAWPYPRHREFEDRLRLAAGSWFREKGYAVHPRYPFILESLAHWEKNIILPEVAASIAAERARRKALRQGFPLHMYAHHGLSSQAMLFNLVGPLILYNDLEPLQRAFEGQGILWPEGTVWAAYEFEDREVFNEDSGQPTSLDLVILTCEGRPAVFVESKLVESEFGSCSVFAAGDCDGRSPVPELSQCYLHFTGRRYWTLLEKFGFLSGPLGAERLCPLAVHYQFFREVLFALELGGSFGLLYDARNPTFFTPSRSGNPRGLIPLLLEFVPAEFQARIGAVSIQAVAAEIRRSGRHPWITDFEKKYGL